MCRHDKSVLSPFLESLHSNMSLILCLESLVDLLFIYLFIFFINGLVGFRTCFGRAISVGELITHGPDLHFLMNNIDRWRATVLLLCMVRSVYVRVCLYVFVSE